MKDRVAVITGASRGIGAAVARRLAGEGARVGLLSRTGDDLGLPDALGVQCDVRDRGQVLDAVAQVVDRFGQLDIAVANAGVGAYGPFLEMEHELVDEMIDINLKGTIHFAQATLPHLVESDAADFVSLASVAGVRAFPDEAVYNASKFGQVGLTRALDHEFNQRGVRCTNVAPGGVATDFALDTGRPKEALHGMLSSDDVAEVVLFCLTRPRGMRMLTTTFRPVSEGSWG
jgi:3-oxoacyl-[acyl-carrier protein] reductase